MVFRYKYAQVVVTAALVKGQVESRSFSFRPWVDRFRRNLLRGTPWLTAMFKSGLAERSSKSGSERRMTRLLEQFPLSNWSRDGELWFVALFITCHLGCRRA
ncbi:hypothetical protein BDW67DRAFT_153838 [Aspergillus spinulosporus]